MTIRITTTAPALLASLLLGALGCSGETRDTSSGQDGGNEDGAAGDTGHLRASARKELQDKGLNKYFGQSSPVNQTVTDDYTVYDFDKADGPICLWGDPYHAMIRDRGSENLFIYLEGGGACWTSFCAANVTANTILPATGILDPSSPDNALADWNVVYAPYCDGSVFAGDNELEATGGPSGGTQTRYHHGLKNLSAVIDLAKEHYPSPKRIFLAGSSAGGYGTLTGTALVMLAYPDTDLIVFNDAGLGLSNPDNPAMFQEISSEWRFSGYIPDGCTDCASGQQTGLIAWGLENNPSLRVAAFSSYGDGIIGGTFLGMAPEAFKALLLEKTGPVHEAFPERFKRFFIEGTAHTTLILADGTGGALSGYFAPPVDGMTVAAWTKGFVDGSSDWTDRLQNGGN